MTKKHTTAAKIINLLNQERTPVGAHLSAQYFADKLCLSRSPINRAFETLADKGILEKQPMRGYFLAHVIDKPTDDMLDEMGLVEQDIVKSVYFQMAEDRLNGDIEDVFSEKLIKQRYNLTSVQLQSVLKRVAEEGWIIKKPGYGWTFTSMLTTPESLIQTYRVRMALEPAALLEPNYRLAQETIDQCRKTELEMLEADVESFTADQLHERGVKFHQAIVEASGNPFFSDTLLRINNVRRLLSYRTMKDRTRYLEQVHQHLHLLDLLEAGKNEQASEYLRQHIESTISNITKIDQLLK